VSSPYPIATLREVYEPQAPSAFAKLAGWILTQSGPAAIDCLRPPDRIGLPVSLLHPAFATFTALLDQPMPLEDENAIKATRIASELCITMAGHFKTETDRKNSLFTTVKPLFPNKPFSVTTFDNATPAGVLMRSNGSVEVVVEVKNEPGTAGDAQMQVARSFDAAAIHNIRRNISEECAAFVLAFDGERFFFLEDESDNDYIGPNLLIGGGFKDQCASVVEPLSRRCSMLPDLLDVREEVLAKHLYALQESLIHLQRF
jgi:hypothetical protein